MRANLYPKQLSFSEGNQDFDWLFVRLAQACASLRQFWDWRLMMA